MSPPESTPREPLSLRDVMGLLVSLAPMIAIEVGGLVMMGIGESPIYWALVRRFGVTQALLAGVVFWMVVVGLWMRVPSMPGLVQGATCIVGWFYIGNSLLVWSAFALGVLCGSNKF